MHGRVFLQTIYLPPNWKRNLVTNAVVFVDPLMHELIRHICERGMVRPQNVEDRTLIRFFSQRLRCLEPVDSNLRIPTDERGQRFASFVLQNPGSSESLETIAANCGTSLRTLQRVFPREVGLPVAKWRHRVRMLRALEMLGQDEPVTTIALSLGFDSVSAFIHSFKTCFGVTPGKYQPR